MRNSEFPLPLSVPPETRTFPLLTVTHRILRPPEHHVRRLRNGRQKKTKLDRRKRAYFAICTDTNLSFTVKRRVTKRSSRVSFDGFSDGPLSEYARRRNVHRAPKQKRPFCDWSKNVTRARSHEDEHFRTRPYGRRRVFFRFINLNKLPRVSQGTINTVDARVANGRRFVKSVPRTIVFFITTLTFCFFFSFFRLSPRTLVRVSGARTISARVIRR